MKTYFDEKLQENEQLFVEQANKMSEQLTELFEVLDALKESVTKIEQNQDQEKISKEYFIGFGRQVQEMRQNEEVGEP